MTSASREPGSSPGDVTHCLGRLAAGEERAAEELFELVHAELRRLAGACMEGERAGHTLQPTALVHEVWLRLFGGEPAAWNDRRHFLRVSARAMRRILIDHARARGRQKRGGGSQGQPLEDWVRAAEEQNLDLCALDEALERLEQADAELARLVELRFFAGLSIADTADALGCSTATVERDWRVARALLSRELGPP